MRVAIVGSGAIGLLYGGWLQSAGLDVVFVTRPGRQAALDGATLTAEGRLSFRLERASAVGDVANAGSFDAIILAVKLYDLTAAATQALPSLAPTGALVAVQNGVSAYGILRPLLDPSRLSIGPVFAATRLTGPASVAYAGADRVTLGNPECKVSPAVDELVRRWTSVGVTAEIAEDIDDVIWTKFLGFATNAALTSLGRLPAGVIYHTPQLVELAKQSIREVASVGRAEGIAITGDAEKMTLRILQSLPPATVASMRQDLDAGKRLELDFISGEIDRLGHKHGLATPLHSLAYRLLQPFREGAPKAAPGA